MANKVNPELKKIVGRVKTAQTRLESMLKDKTWVEDARKYAEKQGKEVRKLVQSDVTKVRSFIEKERKELDRFQKQLPSEVEKFRKFVTTQRKELRRLLQRMGRMKTKKARPRASGGARKSSGRKSSSSAQGSSS